MSNVNFYCVDALTSYNASKHKGIFVHLTAECTVGTVTYEPGLYFGGSNGWELLSNSDSASDLKLEQELNVLGVNVGNLVGTNADETKNTTFSAGTSVEKVLRDMLIKTIDVTATKPSVSLTGVTAGTVEIGTVMKYSLGTTFEDGKFTGNTGYSYTENTTGCAVTATRYYLNGSEITLKDGKVDSVAVASGNNKFKCEVDYSASTTVPKKNNGDDSTVSIAAGTAKSSEINVVGDYKYFIGFSNDKFDDTTWTSTLVRALSLANGFGAVSGKEVTFPTGAKQQVIAIPSGWSFTAKDAAGANIEGTFNQIQTVTVTCGGTHTKEYKVYVAPANAGLAADSKAIITITK